MYFLKIISLSTQYCKSLVKWAPHKKRKMDRRGRTPIPEDPVKSNKPPLVEKDDLEPQDETRKLEISKAIKEPQSSNDGVPVNVS